MKGSKKKNMRRRRYYKQKTHNTDYYGDAAIRTKYEYMTESFLREAGIPYHINHVFCFTCNKFYPYESRDMPRACGLCYIPFVGLERGNMARPDFILDISSDDGGPIIDLSKVAVLRVDGAVHDFNKATRITDYHILQAFKERGIKVFVIRNEMLLEKSVKELRDIFTHIKLMMEDQKEYDKYAASKEFIELTYCYDIEGKRRKRNNN